MVWYIVDDDEKLREVVSRRLESIAHLVHTLDDNKLNLLKIDMDEQEGGGCACGMNDGIIVRILIFHCFFFFMPMYNTAAS